MCLNTGESARILGNSGTGGHHVLCSFSYNKMSELNFNMQNNENGSMNILFSTAAMSPNLPPLPLPLFEYANRRSSCPSTQEQDPPASPCGPGPSWLSRPLHSKCPAPPPPTEALPPQNHALKREPRFIFCHRLQHSMAHTAIHWAVSVPSTGPP